MYKKINTIVIASLIIVFMLGNSVLAAVPEIAYEKDAEGNASEEELFFYLTKPEETETTVFDSCYYVSAIGEEGVEVYFLIFDDEEERYSDLIVEQPSTEEDGDNKEINAEIADSQEILPCVIGASGLLLQEINLPNIGLNKIRIVATEGDLYRIIDRDVTLLDESIKEGIKEGAIMDTLFKIEDIIKNIFNSISG